MSGEQEIRGSRDTVAAVAASVGRVLGRTLCAEHRKDSVPGGGRFVPRSADAGIGEVTYVAEGNRVQVTMDLATAAPSCRVPAYEVWLHVANLGHGVAVLEPRRQDAGTALPVRFYVDGREQLSALREVTLTSLLMGLGEAAAFLRSWTKVPELPAKAAAFKKFAEVAEVLRAEKAAFAPVDLLAAQVASVAAGAPVALTAQDPLSARYALAAVGHHLAAYGLTALAFTRLRADADNLVQLCLDLRGQGGLLAIPATSLVMSVNAYDMGRVARSLLRCMQSSGAPALFFGAREELEVLFANQGAANDPLCPVVFSVPGLPIDTIVEFGTRTACVAAGLAVQQLKIIDKLCREQLGKLPQVEAVRLAHTVVSAAVGACAGGGDPDTEIARQVAVLKGREETLGGLESRYRQERSPRLQERLEQTFLEDATLDRLKNVIIGQDRALDAIFARVRAALELGDPHKPIAVLLEGPPAVGKSETVRYLAETMGIPMLYIDGGSLTSHHQVRTALLGSDRGVVGSFEPGKLEKACRSFMGAFVEFADLDHVNQDARAQAADLCMQLLDRGVIQTSTGTDIFGPNLVIFYTCNLPEDEDRKSRTKFGFGSEELTHKEVANRIESKLGSLFTQAFMSRVGTPVVFTRLSPGAERSIAAAILDDLVRRFLMRKAIPLSDLTIDDSAVDRVIAAGNSGGRILGVRRIAEQARELLAPALFRFHKDNGAGQPCALALAGALHGLIIERRQS